jgi:hypothetical protein
VTDEKLTTINQKIEDASYILEEAQSMGIANPGILALIVCKTLNLMIYIGYNFHLTFIIAGQG